MASWSSNITNHRRVKFEYMRHYACVSADLIVTVTDHLCGFYKNIVLNTNDKPQVKLIPNGFDKEIIEKTMGECSAIASKKNTSGNLELTHIGNITNGREESLFEFLKIIGRLSTTLKSRIILNFAGAVPPRVLKIVYKLTSDINFRYMGQLSYEVALRLAAESDFVLHFGSKKFIDARSTKIYEYAALKRPVISFNYGGELDSFIKDFSIGYSLNLLENDEIDSVLTNILVNKGDFEFKINQFDYLNLAKSYQNQMLSLLVDESGDI